MGMTLPSPDSPMEQARTLMARKDAIELELETQLSILKANNVTMQTPLVDHDGFPRADIDIWNVRTARVRILELRNDLKVVMDNIGRALEGVFDPSVSDASSGSGPSESLKPFAKVNGISPGSPAAEAVCNILSYVMIMQLSELAYRTCRKMILSLSSGD